MRTRRDAFVYIGTEAARGSRGIYLTRMDLGSGQLDQPTLVAATDSPTFLCTDPSKRFLYCTGKASTSGLPFNTVTGFAIRPDDGQLTLVNAQAVAELACCHISTGLGGRVLLAADYGHAKVATFPLDENGHIAPPATLLVYDTATNAVPNRQQVPHVHSINPDVSSRYAFVCDFSADAVKTYALDTGVKQLALVRTTPTDAGAGPRHLTCHPNGKWVYVIHELNGTLSAFDFDGRTGELVHMQTVTTLPADFTGENTTAEIALSPDARFLYASNRGHDSIATYRVDPKTGMLTPQGCVATEGQHPRNFTIEDSGRFMLVSNRDSDTVTVFRLDAETGAPVFTGQQLSLAMPMRIEIIRPRAEGCPG